MGHFKNLGFSTNGNAKLWIRKMLLFNKCDSDQAVSRANVFGKGVGISCSKQLPTGNWEESQEEHKLSDPTPFHSQDKRKPKLSCHGSQSPVLGTRHSVLT